MTTPVLYGGITFDDPFMCWYVENVRRHDIDMIINGKGGWSQRPGNERLELVKEMIKGDIQTYNVCKAGGIDMGQLLGGAIIAAIDKVFEDDLSHWIDTSEAASILRCTTRHVRRLAQDRMIDARLGPTGSWRCLKESVYRYKRES